MVRLRPAPHCRTRIPSYSLKITPANHFINWQQDPHGNWLARLVFPERTDGVQRHGRPDRRDDGDQSVRLLRRALCRDLAVRLSPTTWRGDLAAYLRARRRRAAAGRGGRGAGRRQGQRTVDFLVGLNAQIQRAGRATWCAWSPGCRRPDETLSLGSGLVPRQRLAAGADAAPAGPRRPLRLRLPDPAEGRHRPDRRAAGDPDRLHRPARLGRGLYSRAPAGSASTPPRACCAARAICRWPPRRTTASARADHRRGQRRPRPTSTSR